MENRDKLINSNNEKPAQKCVGFKRKIGNTNYEVEAFYTGTTSETLKVKIKRILRDEVKNNSVLDKYTQRGSFIRTIVSTWSQKGMRFIRLISFTRRNHSIITLWDYVKTRRISRNCLMHWYTV